MGAAGLNRAKNGQSDAKEQMKKLKEIPLKGNRINAKNQKALEPIANRLETIVSGFGTAMEIPSLKRAHQFLPVKLGPRSIIKFKADPAKVGKGLYRKQFLRTCGSSCASRRSASASRASPSGSPSGRSSRWTRRPSAPSTRRDARRS